MTKYMKIIYMNCRLINEYESDLHSCEQYCAAVKSKACSGFEPMIFVIPVQYSTNWANKPTGSWSFCWW